MVRIPEGRCPEDGWHPNSLPTEATNILDVSFEDSFGDESDSNNASNIARGIRDITLCNDTDEDWFIATISDGHSGTVTLSDPTGQAVLEVFSNQADDQGLITRAGKLHSAKVVNLSSATSGVYYFKVSTYHEAGLEAGLDLSLIRN